MKTTLSSVVENCLRAKRLARATRNEYFSTVHKWDEWGGEVPMVIGIQKGPNSACKMGPPGFRGTRGEPEFMPPSTKLLYMLLEALRTTFSKMRILLMRQVLRMNSARGQRWCFLNKLRRSSYKVLDLRSDKFANLQDYYYWCCSETYSKNIGVLCGRADRCFCNSPWA